MNSLNFYRQNYNKNRNILTNSSNAAYFTANVKEPEYKCVNYKNYNFHENNYLQRSFSADNVVIRSRGFKPSDIRDPAKRHFLENLTTKILHVDMDANDTKRIDLQRLLTPANDAEELLHTKNKKMYASSYFYAPSHPTVEDQVELARRISHSLSDVKNMKSKGQSMYVNRKKRSVKWIHDGNGVESGDELESSPPSHKDKIPLKCMMNPNGKVLDIHGIQALGEGVNIEETPSHPEKLFDIVRDLNNQKGRGAEIFAKRRKRSEKWVVEKEQTQITNQPAPPGIPWKTPYIDENQRNNQETDVKENSVLPPLEPSLPILSPLSYAPKGTTNNTCRPFYNPFTLDLSLEPTSTPATGNGNGYMPFPPDVGNQNGKKANGKKKKVQLRAEIGICNPESVDFLPYNVERGKKQSSTMLIEDNATKKSKRNSGVKRKTITEHHAINDPRATSNHRNKSHKIPDQSSTVSISHRDVYNNNGEMFVASQPNRNIYVRDGNGRNYGNNDIDTDEEEDSDDDDDGKNAYDQYGEMVNNEYTPVPVKQLIKEFEKTCRPVMQYKQIDPSKIAQQLCTLDNDMISRYFEGCNYVSSAKHDNEDIERVNNNWNMNVRMPITEEQLVSYNCKEELMPDSHFTTNRGVQRENNVPEDSRQRDWRLKYIDDEETSSTDDSTETSESPTRSFSTLEENDAYNYQQLELSVPSDFLHENGNEHVITNGNVDHTNNGTQIQVPIETNDKSQLILAMVASEEDILQTIKQLRHTPVLNNLIPTNGSSELRPFSELLPDVGNKLQENSEYQGPKLNSYQKLSNYNTAPRGWDQTHTYYRPITFGRPQEATVYSDF